MDFGQDGVILCWKLSFFLNLVWNMPTSQAVWLVQRYRKLANRSVHNGLTGYLFFRKFWAYQLTGSSKGMVSGCQKVVLMFKILVLQKD